MHSTARKSLLTLLCLSAVFALSACENSAEVARKPAIVDSIVQNSVQRCETGKNEAIYQMRLRHLLSGMWSSSLDAVKESGITICLDTRASNSQLAGPNLYYSKDRVIALTDNAESFYTYQRASLQSIGQFKTDINLAEREPYAVAVKRGTKSWDMNWQANRDVLTRVFELNPELKAPPLKTSPIRHPGSKDLT